jgi:hypothetical protein
MRAPIWWGRRAAAIVLIVAPVLAISDPNLWAAAATPRALTPRASGTVHDQLDLLAGSSSTVVYARYHQLASSAAGFRTPAPDLNRHTSQIIARSSDGASRSLGAVPDRARQWSLVGHVLTAVRQDSNGRPTRVVQWWNTASHAHGQITLAKHDRYQNAGPGGVVYTNGSASLQLRRLHGPTTTLGKPFAPANTQLRVTAGPDGLVATGSSGQAKYLRYNQPGRFTQLATGTTDALLCQTVTSAYAACASGEYDDGDLVTDTMILLPLDGSTPTTTSDCPGLPLTAVGSTLFWAGYCTGPTTLSSLPAGGTAPTTSTTRVGPELASAYGKAIALTHSKAAIIAASSVTSSSTVISPRRSPASAAAFALSSGRILYVDDTRNAAHPSALTTAHVRKISPAAQRISVGTSRVVHAGSGTVQVGAVLAAASSKALVYSVTRYGNSSQYVDLRVVTPQRTITVKKVLSYSNISLSGSRLLFQRQAMKGSTANVYNIAADTTRVVRRFATIDTRSTAVSGHYIAYATKHGSVYRENLRTGERVKLAPAHRSYYGDTSVYIHGSWVGWHLHPHNGKPSDYLRNATRMTKTVQLPRALWSLTSRGAILDRADTSIQPAGTSGSVGQATSFRLRAYNGKTRTLLSERNFVTGPQLVGRTLAWVGASGVLHAAAVSAR